MCSAFILDVPLPHETKLAPTYNPLSYLIFYLRRKLGSLYFFMLYMKFSSDIYSNHGSNSSVPKNIYRSIENSALDEVKFLEIGDSTRKSPITVVCQYHYILLAH